MIILTNINRILWGVTTMLLIYTGVYFSKKLKFIQFSFKNMFTGFKKSGDEKVSPFETLMLTLGARIGVGSLAGVALAIYLGGPGTIFWMWVATFIVAPNAYAESFLGVLFHKKTENIYQGGPAYYISYGLNKRWLGKLYALLIIITYIFGFSTIQANTISKSIEVLIGIKPIVTGILLALITGYVIMRGAGHIIKISSKMMPFIAVIYLVISCCVIMSNVTLLPLTLKDIVLEAFNFKSAGYGVLTTFIIGFQRGIFSNEAGIGSGAIAASTVDNDDAKGQGKIQIIGVYFTTLILCTLTAIIVLMSNYDSVSFININGIEITQYALNYHLGSIGEIVLVLTIFIFAFSTIISGYYYGENSLKFIKINSNSKSVFILKLLTLSLLIIGSVISSSFLWDFVDILIAVIGIINVYAIYKLRKKVE